MTNAAISKILSGLDESIIKDMNAYALAGLAVGVIYDGELVYSKDFGFSNIEEKKPVTADTIFRIASISKTFTGIAIMQLVEQGKINLDDPVNQHLRAYKVLHRDTGAPPVTIRHMLTHVAGIGETRDIADIVRPVIGLAADMKKPVLSMAEYYSGQLTPEVYPEQKWAYSNHAFATLGQLVEDVSGVPFAQYMIKNIFEPLGMFKTDYVLSERVRPELAQGYKWKKGKFIPIPYQRLVTTGCGAVHSSIHELALYTAALMNGGANEHGRVLKPETLAQMFESQLPYDQRVFTMGLAFFLLNKFPGHRVVEHSGGWPGFISEMLVAPDDKLAVIVFTNTSSGAPTFIAERILNSLLRLPDPILTFKEQNLLETPHQWENFCGFYAPRKGLLTNFRFIEFTLGEIEIAVKENKLVIRTLAGPGAKGIPLKRCDPQEPMLYMGYLEELKMPLMVLFKTNSQGEVDRIEVDGMLGAMLYKRPFQKSLKLKFLAITGVVGSLLICLTGSLLCNKIRNR